MTARESNTADADKRVSELMRLAQEADAGRFENLECPQCRQKTVTVWFTHPTMDVYRMWYICAACNFHSRAQVSGRPANFSESRINKKLEEYDLAILDQCVFKLPPRT
jgi:ribosomal protein S27E